MSVRFRSLNKYHSGIKIPQNTTMMAQNFTNIHSPISQSISPQNVLLWSVCFQNNYNKTQDERFWVQNRQYTRKRLSFVFS